ncbi:MAG: formylglycine-generating enzyme family protein [Verrucomicrobiota bacterium]
MLGNVWEWCSDRYGSYPPGSVIDPKGPGFSPTSNRVNRGGSWFSGAGDVRSAQRNAFHAGNPVYTLGFRPALSSVQ